ncbi:hypothetical protein OIO90_005270 [Microbotryomycetes sp. JL221]|nr:hypothetical protein OIO90_005270 [Microbotryomycetes sp. JL221]
MSKITYAITGASRGLGFGYAQALLAADPQINVIALCRNPSASTQLHELKKQYQGRVEIVQHEATSEESAVQAAKEVEQLVGSNGIDTLIVNAGIISGGFAGVKHKDAVKWLKSDMEVNVYGLMYTTLAFLPLLEKGNKKQIIFMSSIIGSLGFPMARTPAAGTYAMTKVAVNMFASKLSGELQGFTIVPYHPGYVQTDMNGGKEGNAQISVEEAVDSGVKVFLSLTPEDNMKFKQYTGETLPW